MSLHGVGSAVADTIEQATTDPAGESISQRAGRAGSRSALIVLLTTGNRVCRDPFEGSEAPHGKQAQFTSDDQHLATLW